MRQYEAFIILKPDLQGDALKVSFEEVLDIIKKHQCALENVDEAGRQPLSYAIAKKKEGFYYIVKFKGEPKDISEIKRRISLNDNILRALITVRKEKKLSNA